MINVIIIEDETAACNALVHTLKEAAPDVCIQATLNSVEESISYLLHSADVDLIFSDVQLTDGLSFSIFKQVPLAAPIVFITGYDKFIMNAFEYNGIDYLLKPVTKEDIQNALQKYRRLQQHFEQHNKALTNFLNHFGEKRKARLLVKKGLEHVSLLFDEIVLFYTENKVVFAVDKQGRKFMADKNLTDLEQDLDTRTFFRVNRQYIININYIRAFKPFERVKLQVELTVSDLPHVVVVSQETAPHFKKWILGG